MSRIFNVVAKDNLIGFDELGEADAHVQQPFQHTPEQPANGFNHVLPPREDARVAPLRISALSPIFPFDTEHHAAAEQYRIIRTKILHDPKKPRLIVVSSASSGDGKTVTSINLGASLALKQDIRVLLVDGDLRRPCLSDLLGLPSAPGLLQVLSGSAELGAALLRVEQFPNLFIISAGGSGGNAAELLDSQNWRSFAEQIRRQFSLVIFDAPPIATVADYELLQLACDGVILVARPDHTELAGCMNALKIIPHQKLLGVVLNGVEDWWLWKAPGYAYYTKQAVKRTRSS